MTFDLGIWHAGSTQHHLGHVHSSTFTIIGGKCCWSGQCHPEWGLFL